MKTETFQLELITPCFCGGAEPDMQAEIRAPSIRGQLRWWFRTLGGCKSLAATGMSVRAQEAMIFGSAAGDRCVAARLLVRVSRKEVQAVVRDGQELGHPLYSDAAYLTFPVQSRERHGQPIKHARRGVLLHGGSFDLVIQWRGPDRIWEEILALMMVFANVGSLGFRGRRAMGALALRPGQATSPPLSESLDRFCDRAALDLRAMHAVDRKEAISKLGSWLRGWRAHGRSEDHRKNHGNCNQPPLNTGFHYAKVDHDIGYHLPASQGRAAFRPALGLPIVQRIRDRTNNWEYGQGTPNHPKGRFASPVLLRPHRDNQGRWFALVVFVDARRWPGGKPVFLNGEELNVSLDLYEAMKRDPVLAAFP